MQGILICAIFRKKIEKTIDIGVKNAYNRCVKQICFFEEW